MPFIVHILRTDLADWQLTERVNPQRQRYIYTPASRIPRLVVSSPAPLTSFIDEDIFCKINVEKSPSHLPDEDRTCLYLEQLNRKLTGSPRRLRLKIKSAEQKKDYPPRVILEEL